MVPTFEERRTISATVNSSVSWNGVSLKVASWTVRRGATLRTVCGAATARSRIAEKVRGLMIEPGS